MKIIPLLISLSLILNESPSRFIKNKNFEGYVFSDSEKLEFNSEISNNRFTPTNEEIILTENILKSDLFNLNKDRLNQVKSCPIIDKNLKKYIRQYLGYYVNGEKVIWINFLWKKEKIDNINKKIIIVSDGCSYYWNVKVNISKHKLYDLLINGIC